jgi:hypothetical protein
MASDQQLFELLLPSPFLPFFLHWSPCGGYLAMLSSWAQQRVALRVVDVASALCPAAPGPRICYVGAARPLFLAWAPTSPQLLLHHGSRDFGTWDARDPRQGGRGAQAAPGCACRALELCAEARPGCGLCAAHAGCPPPPIGAERAPAPGRMTPARLPACLALRGLTAATWLEPHRVEPGSYWAAAPPGMDVSLPPTWKQVRPGSCLGQG